MPGLTFDDFLIHMAPIVVLLLVVFVGLCWLMFRRALVEVGVIDKLRQSAIHTTGGRYLLAATRLLFGSAVLAPRARPATAEGPKSARAGFRPLIRDRRGPKVRPC